MIPTRPTYHHGDLRNSLIRAALALVAERGVEGFSLREAARTVGRLRKRVLPPFRRPRGAARGRRARGSRHARRADAHGRRGASGRRAPSTPSTASGTTARPTCTSRSSIRCTSASCTRCRSRSTAATSCCRAAPRCSPRPAWTRSSRPASSRPRPRAARCSRAGRRSHGLASLAVGGQLPLDRRADARGRARCRAAHGDARRRRRPGALPARAPAAGRRLPRHRRARARAPARTDAPA